MSNEATRAILRHAWPSNGRELKNAVLRAAVLRRGEAIEPADLALDGAERLIVADRLRRLGWNRTAAAQALGIAPKTRYDKLKAWDVTHDT